ncbi:MAG: hypothetical protein K8S97_07005 [Anaerolineae bacterium]|nr:hypothetical protein [Anaerolineae bacterium]
MENSLWVAFLALVVAVGGPLFTAWQNARTRKAEWREDRLRWERDYYHDLMHKLIDFRSKLQFLQNKGRDHQKNEGFTKLKLIEWEREREIAYGAAFAIMLTVRKGKMRGKASEVMALGTPPDKKNAAIEEAIEELGDMVVEANRELVPGSRKW